MVFTDGYVHETNVKSWRFENKPTSLLVEWKIAKVKFAIGSNNSSRVPPNSAIAFQFHVKSRVPNDIIDIIYAVSKLREGKVLVLVGGNKGKIRLQNGNVGSPEVFSVENHLADIGE